MKGDQFSEFHQLVRNAKLEGKTSQYNEIIDMLKAQPDARDILCTIFLNEFQFNAFDFFSLDLISILETVPKNGDANSKNEYIRHMICKNLMRLIESGTPTVFIDIDHLSTNSAASMIPTILEKRKQELENAIVYILNKNAYLDNLWMTAYGFRVLKALGMKRITDMRSLQKVRKSLLKLGCTLQCKEIENSEELISKLNLQPLEKIYNYIVENIEGDFSLAAAILKYIKNFKTSLGIKKSDILRNFMRFGISKHTIRTGILDLLVSELIIEVQRGRYTCIFYQQAF